MRSSRSAASVTGEGEIRHADPAAATMRGACASCGRHILLPPTGCACGAGKREGSRSTTTTRKRTRYKATGDTFATPATYERDAHLSEALRQGPRLPRDSQEMEELTGLLLEGYSSGWLELRPP